MLQMMAESNKTAESVIGNASDLILESIVNLPKKQAIINCGSNIDYEELGRLVVTVQQQFIQSGVGRGDVVGLLLSRDRWLIPAMIAALTLGITFVPLDPTYPQARLERYVDVAKPKIIFANAAQSELAHTLHKFVIHTSERNENAKIIHEVMNSDDIAYILFTSGSTGQPKGVSISHQALRNFLVGINEQLEIKSSNVFLAHTTVAFDISILELLLPLSVGGTVLLANNDEVKTIEGILPLVDKCDFVQATPSLWKILLATGWQPSPSLTLLSGGEALPLGLARKLTQTSRRLWNLYGPTEATIWTSCECVEHDAEFISIGKPISNMHLFVMNEELEPCEEGELFISGVGLANGYYGNVEATNKVFISHPATGKRLYRSGDRVRLREQGKIEWLGRGDAEIKIRGNRIGVGEIEIEIENISGITGAVVTGRPFEGHGDDILTAYIVSQAALTKSLLVNQLSNRLPAYMVPDAFVILSEFPLQPNGKFDKKSLPDPNWSNTLHNLSSIDVPTCVSERQKELATTISDVFATTLGRSTFEVTSSFFDLGGNSALAVISAGIISAKLSRKVPVSLIVSGGSPNAIANKILLHAQQS